MSQGVPSEILAMLPSKRLRRMQRRAIRRALGWRRAGYVTLPVPHEQTAIRIEKILSARADGGLIQ